MGRPRKTEGPGKADLAWRALEKAFMERVKDEFKPECHEELLEMLRSLRRGLVWTVPMILKLRKLIEALL
jgi:hypothetical protein